MKQAQPNAAAPTAKPRAAESSLASPLAAAFDRVAQKSGFDNWKQLDREQPLPKRVSAPHPMSDPDAKPEPPRIPGKQSAAAGVRAAGQQGGADVSFADFMKGTKPLSSPAKK
jgi:hypothetical protein